MLPGAPWGPTGAPRAHRCPPKLSGAWGSSQAPGEAPRSLRDPPEAPESTQVRSGALGSSPNLGNPPGASSRFVELPAALYPSRGTPRRPVALEEPFGAPRAPQGPKARVLQSSPGDRGFHSFRPSARHSSTLSPTPESAESAAEGSGGKECRCMRVLQVRAQVTSSLLE